MACLITLSAALVLFGNLPVQAEHTVEEQGRRIVKEFRTIEIDATDTDEIEYRMEDMLGIDQDTSKGSIVWNGDSRRLVIKGVSIFQTEDPLSFDEAGHRKALIHIRNTEYGDPVIIEVVGVKNEIVNYGTTFDLDGGAFLFKSSESGTEEGELHIQNRKTYDGQTEPAIRVRVTDGLYLMGEDRVLSLISTGVGGLDCPNEDQALQIIGRVNLFLDIRQEKIYYDEDPDNLIVIGGDEESIIPALSGFRWLNLDAADRNYKMLDESKTKGGQDCTTAYDEAQKQSVYTDPEGHKSVSSKFYFGKFIYVTSGVDLRYQLSLKMINQVETGAFDNLVLTDSILYEWTYDYDTALYDRLMIRGYKRLFLNGHRFSVQINREPMLLDEYMSWDFHVLCSQADNLEVFGSMTEYETEESAIDFQMKDTTGYPHYIRGMNVSGNMDINTEAAMYAFDDRPGVDRDPAGNAFWIMDGYSMTVFNGTVYGSGDASNPNVAGVIMLESEVNQTHVGLKVVSGCIRSYAGPLISTKDTVGAWYKYNARFYGGTLLNDEREELYLFRHMNQSFFPDSDPLVWIVNGYSSSHPVGPNGQPITYNGVYRAFVLEENKVDCADALFLADPFYRPYLKTDLPETVFVDGTENVTETVELFNPASTGCTMGKGYSARLYLKFQNGTKVQLMPGIDAAPFNQIGFEEVDGRFVLVVLASLSKEFDGIKVYGVIENNYSGVKVTTREMTIRVVDQVTDAIISLTGLKDAFDPQSPTGAVMEMGLPEKENLIRAHVSSAYSDTIAVQWFDVTDPNNPKPASGRSRITMTRKTEDGLYETEFSFMPSVSETGTYEYNLHVYTESRDIPGTVVETVSATAKFTVENSSPIILTQPPASLHAKDGETIEASLTVDDNIPNIGYKWYYYPSEEYMTGIQGNDLANMVFDGVSFRVMSTDDNKQIYSNVSGTKAHDSVTWDLTDVVRGGINRIVFQCAQDLGQGEVRIRVTAANQAQGIAPQTLLEDSFDAIQGNYEFSGAFQTRKLLKDGQYYDADTYQLVLDFSGSPLSATYIIENLRLESLNQETDVWTTEADLNPFFFARTEGGDPANYRGVYELNVTGNPLSYQVSSADDGRYIYCKVFNQYDNTKFVYSRPIRLDVGNNPVQPQIVSIDQSLNARFIEVGDKVRFHVQVAQPIVDHQLAVAYQWNFYRVDEDNTDLDAEKVAYLPISADDLLSEYGLRYSAVIDPSTGEGTCTIELVNIQLACQLYCGYLGVEVTAYSPEDPSLTDTESRWTEVKTDIEGVSIQSVTIYDWFDSDSAQRLEFTGSGDKYVSKDGMLPIRDIICLTDKTYAVFTPSLDNHYIKLAEGYDPYYLDFSWKVDWYEDGVRKTYTLESLWSTVADRQYFTYNVYGDRLFIAFDNPDDMRFQNLVIYCEIYDKITGETYESERYQISYVNLQSLPQLTEKTDYNPEGNITVSDFEIDPSTGDLSFHVSGSTIQYTSPIYISDSYSYETRQVLAIDPVHPLDSVQVQPTFSGRVYLTGPGYIENYVGREGNEYILDMFHYADQDDAVQATFDNKSNFTFNVTIPYEFFERYASGTLKTTRSGLSNEYCSVLKNGGDFNFTEEELTELAGIWFDYYLLSVRIEYRLNYNAIASVFELESIYYPMELLKYYFQGTFEYGTYAQTEFTFKQGSVAYINGTYENDYYGVNDYVVYEWYSYASGEPQFVDTNGDPYLQVDTALPGVYEYELVVTVRKTEDPDKSMGDTGYVRFTVTVEPNLETPEITGISEPTFGYREPHAKISVDAATNEEDVRIRYLFKVQDDDSYLGYQVHWSDENELEVSTEKMGSFEWSVEVYVAKTVENYDGTVSDYFSERVSSGTRHYTVGDRIVDRIEIGGVNKPVQGNAPTTEGLFASPTLEDDTYFGYRVISAFWNPAPQAYGYDTDYELTVVAELLENSSFAGAVSGAFLDGDSTYEGSVTKVGANQVRLTRVFRSTESEAVDSITLHDLPDVQPEALIRKVDTYKESTFELISATWNTDDSSFKYMADYRLTLIVRANNGYRFTDSLTVRLGDGTVPYTVRTKGSEIEIVFEYRFGYTAIQKIGSEETELQSDNQGAVSLSVGSSVPDGKMFDGWYVGDTKVASGKQASYTVDRNGVVIEARFKDIPFERDGDDLVMESEDPAQTDLSDLINAASGNGLGVRIGIGDVTFEMDPETVGSLDGLGDLLLSIRIGQQYATGDLNKADLSNIKEIYEIKLEGGTFVGAIHVSLPATFEVGSKDVLKVFYVSPEGTVENMQATYEDGVISFLTTHFSTYVVTLTTGTFTVSFQPGAGTGTMASVSNVSGGFVLPSSGFTPPAGKRFKGWQIGGVEKQAGELINVTSDTVATALYEDIPHEHTMQQTPGKAATCTEDGLKTYYSCTGCGLYYEDEAGKTQIANIDSWKTGAGKIPATGHQFVWIVDKAATAISTGLKHEECSVCHTKRNENTVIPMQECEHAHTVKTARVEPGCETTGKEAYYYCTNCQKYFSDADCQLVIDDLQAYGIIPAAGHQFVWVVDQPATELSAGIRHEECSVCHTKRNENTQIPILSCSHSAMRSVAKTDPTCETAGKQAYFYCPTCNKYFEDQAGQNPITDLAAYGVLEPIGHAYGEWQVVKPATETEDGLEERVCAHDASHKEQRVIKATGYHYSVDQNGVKVYDLEVEPGQKQDLSKLFETAEQGKGKVIVTIGETVLVFDPKAVTDIGGQTAELTLNVLSSDFGIEDLDGVQLVIEVSLGGTAFSSGSVTVRLPFTTEVPKGQVAKVYYLDPQGGKTDMNAVFEDGYVSFRTNHFSKFAVVFEQAKDGENETDGTESETGSIDLGNDDQTEKKGLPAGAVVAIIFGVLLVLAGAGVGVFFLLKKKGIIKKK